MYNENLVLMRNIFRFNNNKIHCKPLLTQCRVYVSFCVMKICMHLHCVLSLNQAFIHCGVMKKYGKWKIAAIIFSIIAIR